MEELRWVFPGMSLVLCLGFLVTMSRFKGSGRRFMCRGRYWQGEREIDPEIG